MARTWRESGEQQPPERLRPFLDAHQRFEALIMEAGRAAADSVSFHIARAELTAVWEEENVVVTIDGIEARIAHRPTLIEAQPK
jgi:hypothetical protein